jgi:hypothetical protein
MRKLALPIFVLCLLAIAATPLYAGRHRRALSRHLLAVTVPAVAAPGADFVHPGPEPFHPGPEPFHPGPQPFPHGYGWNGGWHANPWNWVAPVITDIATAPRYVQNPVTGQMELRTPGAWQTVNGTLAWVPMPVWPLAAAKVGEAAPAAPPVDRHKLFNGTLLKLLPFHPFRK